MGILILLFFLLLLAVVVLSLLDLKKKVRTNRFSYTSLFFSSFITGIIYLCLILYWKSSGQVYVFEPFFLTVLFCIVTPFLLSRLLDYVGKERTNHLSNSLKGSVIVGLVILIVFNSFIYDITKIIGVTVHH